MEIVKTNRSGLSETNFEDLKFGEVFSDHMFNLEYKDGKWGSPQILPFSKIEMYPSNCTLHYGQAIFEGLKAFYTQEGRINIFRPQKHHERMNRSARALCIPELDQEVFLRAIKELVSLDKEWVPKKRGYALYLRPFAFATDDYLGLRVSHTYRFMIITSPVGAYYKEGMNPVRLITSTEHVRAVKGGLGEAKTPANYAASLYASEEAKKLGYSQVLWLDGIERKYVEEVGSMNMFFLIDDELVTPALQGSILAGVTRDSVIQVARDWNVKVSERRISIDEVFQAAKEGRLREAFGSGTAAVISPVGEIHHDGETIIINDGKTGSFSQKMYDEITGIQYGERPDKFEWCYTL